MRLYLLLVVPLLMAQPRLQNVRQQTRAAGNLSETMRSLIAAQKEPAWIAYAVPQLPGERQMCCWSSNAQGQSANGCALEPQPEGQKQIAPSGTVHLEGGTEFFVFLRVENQRVEKLRSFSVDCSVDGGGLPLFWLTGVNAAQSVALLESLIPDTDLKGDRRLADGAISAIALHRDPAADLALDRLIAPSRLETTRRQAAFWLGNARGRRGYESLARLVREDPSDKVREHVVFALTQSKEPQAVDAIVRASREDRSPKVRSKALFWLGQHASRPVAEQTIRAALSQDPDPSVRKQATFALTRIPNGNGVPLLIETARGSKDEAVRKQALFWLGQSKDPRATRFFEEVLATR